MRSFKRPNAYRGIDIGSALPGDRRASGYLSLENGRTLVRKSPKVPKGKAAVKAKKRKRQTARNRAA